MNDTTPKWVGEAAALPLAFAQVREDALLDRWVVERVGKGARVLLVGSGGCTAALLAAMPQVERLDLVDPNPAQLALARLKIRLLVSADRESRLAVLGHAAMPARDRRRRLESEFAGLGLGPDAIGPIEHVTTAGPDHAGRYECVFAAVRNELNEVAEDVLALLRLDDPAEQARRVAPAMRLGRALDEALDRAMPMPILVQLFGTDATRNPVEPFSRHFARRLRHALATLPAARNPYLWQMLAARYPDGCAAPWIDERAPARLPDLTWSVRVIDEALESAPAAYDFVHLSNVLDWLSAERARATLALAAESLRPGGWTLIRQLNSTLDIAGLGTMFEWRTSDAQALHARDRSFFYRALHLGRKR